MPAINLSSGTGETSIITTAAGEHFWCESITIVPDAAGVFSLWSGSVASGTRRTGDIDALAGVSYTFFNVNSETVGDNLVLSRTDAMAIGGAYTGRVK